MIQPRYTPHSLKQRKEGKGHGSGDHGGTLVLILATGKCKVQGVDTLHQ